MGFILEPEFQSLKNLLKNVVVQRLLFGVILLILGTGIIVITTATQTLMLASTVEIIDGLLSPQDTEFARFLIGAVFIAVALFLLVLAIPEENSDDSPYSRYSWS